MSPKHGVNPVMGVCRFCGREDGLIGMPGLMHRRDDRGVIVERDIEAPKKAVISMEPCPTCQGLTQDGVILLSVTNSQTPERSGEFAFLWPHELSARFQGCAAFPDKEKAVGPIMQKRIAFISDELWDILKLPRKRDDKREFVEIAKYSPKAPLNVPITPRDEFAVDILFGAEHFKMSSYLWWDGEHLLVSLVEARQPWRGSFKHFVHMCQEFKVPLRVPTPVNFMPTILTKWGWTKSIEIQDMGDAAPGQEVEVWDPPKEGPWIGAKTA